MSDAARCLGIVFANVRDNLSEIVSSRRGPPDPHHDRKELFDPFHDFVMLQQLTTLSSSTAFFHSFNEAHVIFEHPVNSFFDDLGCVFAGAGGEVPEAGFRIR